MRVLVTGASRGIGRAVAHRLHRRGATLALSARSDANLEPVLAETPGSVGISAELESAEEVDTLVPRAVRALGGLDGFVHCAGIVRPGTVLEVPRADMDAQLAVNFTAGWKLMQDVARVLAATGSGGAIVQVASTLGIQPAPGRAAYSASKAALIAATRSFALELAPRRIRVNVVAPGVIDTDMLASGAAIPDGVTAEERARRLEQRVQQLAALHPIGRLGTADEVAEAVEYLLFAGFVTGSVLVIDGGLTLR